MADWVLAVVVLVLLALVFLLRWRWMQRPAGTIIELEKLVKCKSCGSLIPEGVRKCAFCGAWQRTDEASAMGANP